MQILKEIKYLRGGFFQFRLASSTTGFLFLALIDTFNVTPLTGQGKSTFIMDVRGKGTKLNLVIEPVVLLQLSNKIQENSC